MSKMMRVSDTTANSLDDLAKQTGKSKQFLIEKAIDVFAREFFLRRANDAYARLKKDDPAAWKEMVAEVKEWDTTLMDGLDLDE